MRWITPHTAVKQANLEWLRALTLKPPAKGIIYLVMGVTDAMNQNHFFFPY
jgi:hypothetical protein